MTAVKLPLKIKNTKKNGNQSVGFSSRVGLENKEHIKERKSLYRFHRDPSYKGSVDAFGK